MDGKELQTQFEAKWLKPWPPVIDDLNEVADIVNHNNVVYAAIHWVGSQWMKKKVLDLRDEEVAKAIHEVFKDPEYGGKPLDPLVYADTFRKCVDDAVLVFSKLEAGGYL